MCPRVLSPLPAVETAIVGKISSASFADKWGTPRQGQLTPESRCELEITWDYEISRFVGILWTPHLSQSKTPLQSLVRPPKAHGNFKCGVFATRSPHRPSAVCLTIAKVEQVSRTNPQNPKQVTLLLSGCDMTQDTPVIAVFPYRSELHAVGNCRVPRWVREANTVQVFWGIGAVMDLENLLSDASDKIRVFKLIHDTLVQDPRSLHSKKQQTQPVHAVKIEIGKSNLLAVTYQHLDGEFVRVLRLERCAALGKLRTQSWLDALLKKMPFLLASWAFLGFFKNGGNLGKKNFRVQVAQGG
jgi:tRNA (Thr-GGU) A37 N-methylase